MFDGNLASQVIYATLTADTTLMSYISSVVEDVYGDGATAIDAAYPFVSFSLLTPEDFYYNGRVRAYTGDEAIIRGIMKFDAPNSGSYAGTLQNIADRIDTLLHNKTLPVMSGASRVGTATIYRVSPYRERYLDGSVEFRHLGGIYHIDTYE